MNIYPVQMDNLSACAPSFGAKFIHNEISKDLIKSSSVEDVLEFNAACEALKGAKRDQCSYLLSGITSGYGVCSEAEVDDKYVDLNCKANDIDMPCSLQTWFIKNENIVSGGYEKRTLLKEITKRLNSIATENAYRPAYNPAKAILKKATKVL